MKTLKLVGVLSVLFAINSVATTFYVSPTGNDANSGVTWNSAVATIGRGISLAQQTNDVVLVTNGTYVVTTQINLIKPITLKSVNGASVTIIDGNYPNTTNRVIFMYSAAPRAVVDGFTIRNGYGKQVGYKGNYHNGGGIRIEYGGIVRNCIIKDNYSEYCGGGIYLHHGGNVYNCTIVNNNAKEQGGGIHCFDVAGGQIRNCVVYFNSASSNVNWGNNGHPIANTCTTPDTKKVNAYNIYVDPQFVSSTDYRLKSTSPCINIGYNMTWMTNATDIDGSARIIGNIVDIGVHEYNGLRYAITITMQPESLNVGVGNVASFNVSAFSLEQLTYQWQKDGTGVANVRTPGYAISPVALSDQGGYRCVISNPFASITSSVASLTVLEPPEITEQPQPATVNENVAVVFSVKAKGSDPLNYQWKKNGNKINNANNATYNIPSANKECEGEYVCEVANPVGLVSSLSAILTVVQVVPPEPTPEPSFYGVVASDGIYSDKVRVTWGALEEANKYQIWKSNDTNFHHAKMLDVVNGLMFEDMFDKHDNQASKYYYWVRAIGIPGQGTALSGYDSGYKGIAVDHYYFCADYDNDGHDDWVVYTPSNGTIDIYLTASQPITIEVPTLKDLNAIAVMGDYTGDGKADLVVYNPENYCWYAANLDGGLVIFWEIQLGWNGTMPVAGDYDGDGMSDYALYDTETYKWYIYNISGQQVLWGVVYGCEDGKPISGDYNQDGIYDLIIKDEDGHIYAITLNGETLAFDLHNYEN